jgi:SAM-dependent methyltransferase
MVQDFYDQLAPYYHLIFEDWQASIDRQGDWLDAIIRAEWGSSVRRVLDAAAGIGTQALALAAQGYQVTASDLSPLAVARAKREAEGRGLSLTTATADLRELSRSHGQFDLVIACDNAVPHLLSDEDILKAFRECRHCLRTGGGCLISVRDYGPRGSASEMYPYAVRPVGDGRYLLFQVWDWDGQYYDLSFYVMHEEPEKPVEVQVLRTRYYAVPVKRLLELMLAAGFEKVRRLDGQFYQPVLIGTKEPIPTRLSP